MSCEEGIVAARSYLYLTDKLVIVEACVQKEPGAIDCVAQAGAAGARGLQPGCLDDRPEVEHVVGQGRDTSDAEPGVWVVAGCQRLEERDGLVRFGHGQGGAGVSASAENLCFIL